MDDSKVFRPVTQQPPNKPKVTKGHLSLVVSNDFTEALEHPETQEDNVRVARQFLANGIPPKEVASNFGVSVPMIEKNRRRFLIADIKKLAIVIEWPTSETEQRIEVIRPFIRERVKRRGIDGELLDRVSKGEVRRLSRKGRKLRIELQKTIIVLGGIGGVPRSRCECITTSLR